MRPGEWTLSFPKNKNLDPHVNLISRREVIEAVEEECRNALGSVGEKAYDLVLPPEFGSWEEIDELGPKNSTKRELAISDAHRLGIEIAAKSLTSEAMEALWRDETNDGDDFRLPDKTVLRLTWESNPNYVREEKTKTNPFAPKEKQPNPFAPKENK